MQTMVCMPFIFRDVATKGMAAAMTGRLLIPSPRPTIPARNPSYSRLHEGTGRWFVLLMKFGRLLFFMGAPPFLVLRSLFRGR
jgi:hypothetical protein